MGSFIINGLPYGGAQYRELTHAEYNALSAAEKMNGTLYFITDGAPGGGGGYSTEIISTLTAGSTTLTMSDNSITTNSTLDFYTDIYGVSPTDVSVLNGSVTLTFEAQQSNMNVKVRVS